MKKLLVLLIGIFMLPMFAEAYCVAPQEPEAKPLYEHQYSYYSKCFNKTIITDEEIPSMLYGNVSDATKLLEIYSNYDNNTDIISLNDKYGSREEMMMDLYPNQLKTNSNGELYFLGGSIYAIEGYWFSLPEEIKAEIEYFANKYLGAEATDYIKNCTSMSTIRLVEKVPEGYTAEQTEYFLDLLNPPESNELIIVNKKNKVLGDIFNPKTGIINYLPVIYVLLIVLVLYLVLIKRKKVFVLIILLIPMIVVANSSKVINLEKLFSESFFGTNETGEIITVRKVDQDGNPMEGVEFETYLQLKNDFERYEVQYAEVQHALITNKDFSNDSTTVIINDSIEVELTEPKKKLFGESKSTSSDLSIPEKFYLYDLGDVERDEIYSIKIKGSYVKQAVDCLGQPIPGKTKYGYNDRTGSFNRIDDERSNINVTWEEYDDNCKVGYKIPVQNSDREYYINNSEELINLKQFKTLSYIVFDTWIYIC